MTRSPARPRGANGETDLGPSSKGAPMSKLHHSFAVATALCTALLSVPFLAAAAYATTGPVLTQDSSTNGCNGVLPTPGSENTTKRLDPDFPSDFNPGGIVGYIIDF